MSIWCPVVSSKEIKKLIVKRCNDLGVTFEEVCESCHIDHEPLIEGWINDPDPTSKKGVRSQHIIKIGKKVGIEIRVLAVVKDLKNYNRKEILNK